jgi:hypothetical protein
MATGSDYAIAARREHLTECRSNSGPAGDENRVSGQLHHSLLNGGSLK